MLTQPYLDEVAHSLSGTGFKILLDLTVSARRPVKLAQIPYRFRPRLPGQSKPRYRGGVGIPGARAFDQVVRPAEVDGQRASALRFGDKRVQALFTVLVVFSFQLRGFTNSEMRVLLAQLLGFESTQLSLPGN